MPLQKLQFHPGVNRETTEYTNSGGWYDADKVRFRAGLPEKLGGWVAVANTPLTGTCRHLHQWSSLESDRYVGLGTSSHLYILWSQSYYDITPVRATAGPLTNPFLTSATGPNDMQVTVTNHHAVPGDYIVVSGASGFDAYASTDLNTEFIITRIVDDNNFLITMPKPYTTAGVAGGGAAVNINFLIYAGLDDAIVGMGWGIPPWGGAVSDTATYRTGWGQAFDPTQLNPADPTVNQIRLWDLDNFGADLVANIRGGGIYYWHQPLGLAVRASPLTQAVTVGLDTFTPIEVPTMARQILVSPNDRHLIAMGCDHPQTGITKADLLLVRWSNEEDAYNWQPLRTNSAGSQRLSAGSYIICGLRTRSEILIWTDLGLWSMKYIGTPYIFGFDAIAEGLSIIGPNAAINAGSVVYWMDRGIFYSYTGQTQELRCTLKDYVFSDMNYLQSYKVYAAHNHAFSEISWFYPSAGSLENDRYITYNYQDQIWSKGALERTAWLDMGRANYPIATDRTNALLYFHEYGDDADGTAMPVYIDSADIDLDGGEHYLFMSRFVPDVFFRGSAEEQAVGITIYGRSAPGKPKQTLAHLQVTPYSAEQYIRVRERQISFRIESSNLGVGWRVGTIRTDMQPDGRR